MSSSIESSGIPLHTKHAVCRLCHSSNYVAGLPLYPVPIGEHYSDNPVTVNDRFPIDIYHCLDCGAVQTQDDINPEYLWKDYTYFSGQTGGIVKHFREFSSDLLSKYSIKTPKNIFDIGSNDGSLLECFKEKGHNVWGADPADTVVKVAREKSIDTYHGLFNRDFVEEFEEQHKKADIITAFNVFAHSADMQGMIDGVKSMLSEDGLFCFEVQYLGDIVKRKILGTIFHEHMIHYSYTAAENFMRKNGLKLIDAWRNNIQFGSVIFIATHADSDRQTEQHVTGMFSEEEAQGLTDLNWGHELYGHIQEMRRSAKQAIDSVSDEGRIYGYGAARSGPTLCIQYGIENKLSALLDDHPSKCGKYAPFESLKVLPSEALYSDTPELTVIMAYIHTKNIINQNEKYLDMGGKFLTLWPVVMQVQKDNMQDYMDLYDRYLT